MKKILLLTLFAGVSFISSKAQWVKQSLPVSMGTVAPVPNNLAAANANVVWASNGRQLFQTSDGGMNWTNVTPHVSSSVGYNLISLQALNDSTAFILSHAPTGHLHYYELFKTTNNGLTWVKLPYFYNTGGSILTRLVHFFDADNGITFTDKTGFGQKFMIQRTTNGGQSWSPVPDANLPALPASGAYSGETGHLFSAIGNNIWIGVMHAGILKSADKGLTWSLVNTGFSGTNPVNAIAFKDPMNGLVSKNGSLMRTTDGGNTWAAISHSGNFSGTELEAIPGANGVYFSAGTIGSAYSPDNGLTWTQVESNVYHKDLAFVNSNTGYSIADTVVHKLSGIALGAPENLAGSGISVSPNPSNGIFSVHNSSGKPYALEVHDVLGRKLIRYESNTTGINQVNLSGKKTGIYILHIVTLGNQFIEKIFLK